MDDTQKNINEVIQSFYQFKEWMKYIGFNIKDFINFMEPVFHQTGYREPQQDTGQQHQTKILIIQDAGSGDFIIHSGVIREIRRLHPDAYISLVIKSPAVELAYRCPYVNELFYQNGPLMYGDFDQMFKDHINMAQIFLKDKYDICYSFAYVPETQLLMYMSGARERVSMNVYTNYMEEANFTNTQIFTFKDVEAFYTHIVPRPSYYCHRADMAFAVLEHYLKTSITNRSLEVWYDSSELENAKSFIKDANKPLYALCMGGSYHLRKKYPPEKYAEFIKMVVAREENATFVILGAGLEDLESSITLIRALPKEIRGKSIIDLTNEISFRESAAVLSLCDAYIGNDTGTKHLAAAVKCPVLEVNCYAFDIPVGLGDNPAVYYAYMVPNVIVRPKKALQECANDEIYHDPHGCKTIFESHCIAQIDPQTLLTGLDILKQKIMKKEIDSTHIS